MENNTSNNVRIVNRNEHLKSQTTHNLDTATQKQIGGRKKKAPGDLKGERKYAYFSRNEWLEIEEFLGEHQEFSPYVRNLIFSDMAKNGGK